MTALPKTTTPEALAEHMGWSPRRVRKVARDLGACRVMGNRMVLLPVDVVAILRAAKPGTTIDEIRAWYPAWIAADANEIAAERLAQDWSEPTGLVYFVQRGDEVKIGYTTNLPKRLVNFRSASTEDFTVLLTIPGTERLEAYFHAKFTGERVAREWFRLGAPIREFVARRQHTIENGLIA